MHGLERARRCAGWRPRGHTQVREDPHDHDQVLDRGEDFQLAATRAMLNIDVEHAFEQPRPSHTLCFAVRVLVRGFARSAPRRRARSQRAVWRAGRAPRESGSGVAACAVPARRVGYPASFEVKPPVERRHCGKRERQQLAGLSRMRPPLGYRIPAVRGHEELAFPKAAPTGWMRVDPDEPLAGALLPRRLHEAGRIELALLHAVSLRTRHGQVGAGAGARLPHHRLSGLNAARAGARIRSTDRRRAHARSSSPRAR